LELELFRVKQWGNTEMSMIAFWILMMISCKIQH